MKKIYKSVLVLTVFFFGCTTLDEEPVGILAPEGFFETTRDVETVTLGAYGWLAHRRMFGDHIPLYLWLSSDMVGHSGFRALGPRESYDEFPVEQGISFVEQMWESLYQVVSTANSAIDGAESIVGLSSTEINEAQASARFIRGFAYYYLAMMWGNVPYIDFFVTDPESMKDISSTAEAVILQRVVEDFEFAKSHLADENITIRSLPTKGTAAAYLASVHLYTGNYQAAYNESKWVIDNSGTYGYLLEADYQTLFDESANNSHLNEPIFTVDNLRNILGPGQQNFDLVPPLIKTRGSIGGGFGLAVPEEPVLLTWDDRDYRKEVNMLDSAWFDSPNGPVLRHYSTFPTPPRPHIDKWITRLHPETPGLGINSGNNYALMRYGELLLTAAEALAEVNGGPNSEAEGYVNQIRERARNANGIPNTYPADVTLGLGKDEFIDLVLEERRVELAFEWKRWFDIKRRDLGTEVFINNPVLEDRPDFSAPRDYYLPIPQSALDQNPNLGQVIGG